MFDPHNPQQFQKLAGALQWSREQMRAYNSRAMRAWKQYVGHEYGQNETVRKTFINLMAQAVDTFVDRLAANSPRLSFNPVPWSANARYLRTAAKKLQSVVNSRLKTERFEKSVQCAVSQAMFGVGAIKVGLRDMGQTNYGGEMIYRSGPYFSPILMEDLLVDMTSRAHDQYGYVGHRYSMYLDEAMEDPSLDPAQVNALRNSTWLEGPPDERMQSLGTTPSETGCYVDQVELWDVYIPRERLLLTTTRDFSHLLRSVPWKGPPRGPIKPLYLRYVPGNAMPRGFALDLCELHELANDLYSKQADQARAQKTVFEFLMGEGEDAERLRAAPNLHAVATKIKNALTPVAFPGADPGVFQYLRQVLVDFSKYAGGLDIMAGLGTNAPTATQDTMLNANSSRLVEALGKTLIDFVAEVGGDYAWYLWTDPVETYPIETMVPGLGMIQDELKPHERSFDFYEMQLSVDPYSMSAQTPAGKLQALQAMVAQTLLPMLPVMQQQGMGIDVAELLRIQSELAGQPDWQRIITVQGMPMDAGSAQAPEQRKPMGGPPREYVRTSVSGTPQGAEELPSIDAGSMAA